MRGFGVVVVVALRSCAAFLRLEKTGGKVVGLMPVM
jgi:hypothetical protein